MQDFDDDCGQPRPINEERSPTSGHEPKKTTEAADTEQDSDPVSFVRRHLADHGIERRFDGSFSVASAPRMARNHGEVDAYLALDELDETVILDRLLLQCKADNVPLKPGDAQRALREVMREMTRARLGAVMRPVMAPVHVSEKAEADAGWAELATAFETDSVLTIAILKHFQWQVKRKTLGLPVEHHLMPIVFSQTQGTGKTTFAVKFLSPLKELATPPVLLSDFADHRSGEIYRYPAVLIDDVGAIPPSQVPVLKSLLSSEQIERRRLRTSLSTKIRQKATPFGTANTDITNLVIDESGHRRFAMLPFRNGSSEKGGDPGIWETVNSIDYALLWRSVDPFGPSPIKPQLSDLVRHQGTGRADVLRSWLSELDLSSEDIRRILTRDGARAHALWELFCVQTGSTMTQSRFGLEMRRHAADPAMPFGPKIRKTDAVHYPLKKRS